MSVKYLVSQAVLKYFSFLKLSFGLSLLQNEQKKVLFVKLNEVKMNFK